MDAVRIMDLVGLLAVQRPWKEVNEDKIMPRHLEASHTRSVPAIAQLQDVIRDLDAARPHQGSPYRPQTLAQQFPPSPQASPSLPGHLRPQLHSPNHVRPHGIAQGPSLHLGRASGDPMRLVSQGHSPTVPNQAAGSRLHVPERPLGHTHNRAAALPPQFSPVAPHHSARSASAVPSNDVASAIVQILSFLENQGEKARAQQAQQQAQQTEELLRLLAASQAPTQKHVPRPAAASHDYETLARLVETLAALESSLGAGGSAASPKPAKAFPPARPQQPQQQQQVDEAMLARLLLAAAEDAGRRGRQGSQPFRSGGTPSVKRNVVDLCGDDYASGSERLPLSRGDKACRTPTRPSHNGARDAHAARGHLPPHLKQAQANPDSPSRQYRPHTSHAAPVSPRQVISMQDLLMRKPPSHPSKSPRAQDVKSEAPPEKYMKQEEKRSPARSGSQPRSEAPPAESPPAKRKRSCAHTLRNKDKKDLWCRNCGVLESPQWRHLNGLIVCNACGVHARRSESFVVSCSYPVRPSAAEAPIPHAKRRMRRQVHRAARVAEESSANEQELETPSVEPAAEAEVSDDEVARMLLDLHKSVKAESAAVEVPEASTASGSQPAEHKATGEKATEPAAMELEATEDAKEPLPQLPSTTSSLEMHDEASKLLQSVAASGALTQPEVTKFLQLWRGENYTNQGATYLELQMAASEDDADLIAAIVRHQLTTD